MADKPKSWPLPELDAYFQVPKYTALPPDPVDEEAQLKPMTNYEKLEWLHSQLSEFIEDRYAGVHLGDMLEVIESLREPYLKEKIKWSKKRTVHKTLTFDDYKGD